MVLASLGLSGEEEEGLDRALVECPSPTPATLGSTTGISATAVEAC